MSLVGKKAPLFTAPAVLDGNTVIKDFSLEKLIGKKEVLLFFYPKDFTFVCPTELISFQEYLLEFEARNIAVIGCSTDSEETHLAWLHTPIEKGGIQGVTYPIVSDQSKNISMNYGVLGGTWKFLEDGTFSFKGIPIAYRGTFFIDKEGIIRHETVNDFPIGRNIEEVLRIIDMWHHVKKYGEVCPANWNIGKKALKPTKEGVVSYLSDYVFEADDLKSGCCKSPSPCACKEPADINTTRHGCCNS